MTGLRWLPGLGSVAGSAIAGGSAAGALASLAVGSAASRADEITMAGACFVLACIVVGWVRLYHRANRRADQWESMYRREKQLREQQAQARWS